MWQTAEEMAQDNRLFMFTQIKDCLKGREPGSILEKSAEGKMTQLWKEGSGILPENPSKENLSRQNGNPLTKGSQFC